MYTGESTIHNPLFDCDNASSFHSSGPARMERQLTHGTHVCTHEATATTQDQEAHALNVSLPNTATAVPTTPQVIAASPRGAVSNRFQSMRTGSRSSGKSNAQRSTVPLEQIVIDAFEYHGLNRLLLFLVYFISASFALFTQWGNTSSAFKSTIINSFAAYGTGNDWEQSQLVSTDSLADGVDYITGYMQGIVSRTESLNVDNQSLIWVDEFALVTYARLVLDLNLCPPVAEGVPCLYSSSSANMMTATYCLNSSSTDTDTAVWYDCTGTQDAGQGYTVWVPDSSDPNATSYISTLADPGIVTHTRQDMLNVVDIIESVYKPVVGKYGESLKLQLYGTDRSGHDAAIFQLSIRAAFGYRYMVRQSSTTPVKKNFTAVGLVCFSLFIACAVLDAWHSMAVWCSSALQHNSVLYHYASLSRTWNFIQMLSILFNATWVVWFFVEVAQVTDLQDPYDAASFDAMETQADLFATWLYWGVLCVFFVGIRIVRHMRIHTGLVAFYNLFLIAGSTMIDFVIFVLYILLVLCAVVFAVFQISGGNSDFVLFPDGLAALTQLSFYYYTPTQFTNNASGLGVEYAWVATALFWVCLVLLVLFTQNTLLAIFTNAYERSRRSNLRSERNFLVLLVCRLRYLLVVQVRLFSRITWRLMSAGWARADSAPPPPPPASSPGSSPSCCCVPGWCGGWMTHLEETCLQEKLSAVRAMLDLQLDEGRSLDSRPTDLLHARWMLASCDAMKSMAAYYSDFAALSLRDVPQWCKLQGRIGVQPPPTAPEGSLKTVYADLANDYEQEGPRQRSLLTRHRMSQLMEFVEVKKLLLQERLSFSGCAALHSLLPCLTWGVNPFRHFKQEHKEQLLQLLMAVYSHVPKPVIDADDDSIDDDEPDQVLLMRRMQAGLKRHQDVFVSRLETRLGSLDRKMQEQSSNIAAQQLLMDQVTAAMGGVSAHLSMSRDRTASAPHVAMTSGDAPTTTGSPRTPAAALWLHTRCATLDAGTSCSSSPHPPAPPHS